MSEKMKELQQKVNAVEDAINALTGTLGDLSEGCHSEALSLVIAAPDKAEAALRTELHLNALAGACVQCLNALGVYGGGLMAQVRDHFEPAPVAIKKGAKHV